MKLLKGWSLNNNLCHSMSYSEFLKRTRKAANLTQGQLADAVSARGHNVTISAISNIERAYYKKRDGSESQPSKSFVILAAEVTGADVNAALAEADYAPIQDTAELVQIVPGITIRIENSAFGSDADREHAIETVRTVIAGVLARRQYESNNKPRHHTELKTAQVAIEGELSHEERPNEKRRAG
jgi:transcriptional regulator with XRE-family HTH domain